MVLKNIRSHDWNDPTDENEFQRAEREKRQADWRAHHLRVGPVRFANAVTRNAVKGEVQEEEKGEDPGKTLCNTYYI